MTVYDYITKRPDDLIRIVRYDPAPDKMDEHGHLYCDEEGTSTVVFDSATGEGDLEKYLLEEVSAVNEEETEDGCAIYELEFVPEEYLY